MTQMKEERVLREMREVPVPKMTVGVFTAPGKLEFREIMRPAPHPNQVLVKIKACAICTVEQRMWSGTKITGTGFPFVGGHEASAEVVEVGSAVRQDFKPGDKVVLGVTSDCGSCYYCRRGMPQRCKYGFNIYGRYVEQYEGLGGMWGFSEYRVVNENELFKANGDVPFEQLALGEPLACVVHSMRKLDVQIGDDMVIIGVGPMGSLNLLVANRIGARTIVSELLPSRIEKAKLLGANVVINAAEADPVEQVKALTEGRGAPFVIAAIGSGKVNEQALKMMDYGGRMVVFAAAYPPTPIELDPNLVHSKEFVISGTNGKDANDLRISAKLLSQRLVNVEPLIEQVFPFKRLEDALNLAVNQKTYRVVVKMD